MFRKLESSSFHSFAATTETYIAFRLVRVQNLFLGILDMDLLAVASRSRLLETEPKLFVFETSYYAFCGRYCFFDSSARTVFNERWRHLTYSNEPNFINNVLLVAKEYFHFKLSNVTKRSHFYGIVLFNIVRVKQVY